MASVARRAIRKAKRLGASPRELKALTEAGLVESNMRHLTGGDRDSTGFLQQRPSQGWGPVGQSVETDTAQFINAAKKINRNGFRGSAGQLAQAVQRSAFPGRYDQRSGEASRLLAQFGGRGGSLPAGTSGRFETKTTTIPGVNRSADRQALLLNYLASGQRHQPTGLLQLKQALDQTQDTPSRTKTTRVRVKGSSTSPSSPSSGRFDVKELFWQGKGGIDVKDGKVVPQGFVSGHTDHVHVASGPRQILRLAQMAKDMGLRVGENPAFGGVAPVHAEHSNHYKIKIVNGRKVGEAIDVSGDPQTMAAYARRVARLRKR